MLRKKDIGKWHAHASCPKGLMQKGKHAANNYQNTAESLTGYDKQFTSC
jgi:hypothetical protein